MSNVQKYLLYLGIVTDYAERSPPRRFCYRLLYYNQIMHLVRWFVISFNRQNETLCVILGDISPMFGDARDYMCFAMVAGVGAISIGMTNMLRLYRKNVRWTHELEVPEAGTEDLSVFGARDKKLLDMTEFMLKQGLVICLTVAAAYLAGHISWLFVQGSLDYAIYKLFWTTTGTVQCFHFGSIVVFSPIMYVGILYRLDQELAELKRQINLYLKEKREREVKKILHSYHHLYERVRQQNRFWSTYGGWNFLMSSLCSIFAVYIQNFATIEGFVRFLTIPYATMTITLSVLLPAIGASYFNSKAHRLLQKLYSVSRHERCYTSCLTVLIDDVAKSAFVTCMDLFSYNSKITLIWVMEIGLYLMLSLALKNKTPS